MYKNCSCNNLCAVWADRADNIPEQSADLFYICSILHQDYSCDFCRSSQTAQREDVKADANASWHNDLRQMHSP